MGAPRRGRRAAVDRRAANAVGRTAAPSADRGVGRRQRVTDDERPDTVAGPPSAGTDVADGSAHVRHGRGATLLAQLRRRHEAALRLPPLPHNGRRDPLRSRERVDGRARP